MQTLARLRADPDDLFWLDRDRVVRAPGAGGAAADGAPDDGELALGGPPGLAFGVALGLALAERLLAQRFGRSLVDHRTWLLAGPAELAAGTSHEAAAVAGLARVGRLTVIAALAAEDGAALARFTAMGWTVRRCAAGDADGLQAAVSAAQRSQKPTLVTVLGQGEPAPEPAAVALAASPYGGGARRAWLKRLRRHAAAAAFQQAFGMARLPAAPGPGAEEAGPSPLQAVRDGLARLTAAVPELAVVPAEDDRLWRGRHHAAAAAQLGLALHGGLVPAGWYPPVALPALMPALAAAVARAARLLCLVPGAVPAQLEAAVFSPCGAAEAAECLALALNWPRPAILALSGATIAGLPPAAGACARGGYVLAPAADGPDAAALTLVASGEDVGLALAVQGELQARGVNAAVASLPCRRLFAAQDTERRDAVLGPGAVVCLSAEGVTWGWAEPPTLWQPGGMRDAGMIAKHIAHRVHETGAKSVEIVGIGLASAGEFD
jgi:transketolase